MALTLQTGIAGLQRREASVREFLAVHTGAYISRPAFHSCTVGRGQQCKMAEESNQSKPLGLTVFVANGGVEMEEDGKGVERALVPRREVCRRNLGPAPVRGEHVASLSSISENASENASKTCGPDPMIINYIFL
jgi:hypothetical protein